MRRAALIDNALNEDILRDITNRRLSFSLSVKDSLSGLLPSPCHDISHGTVCAAVFLELAPSCDAGFISVADERGGMPIKNIVTALHWCLENKIDLVCMSVGTENWWDLQILTPIMRVFEGSEAIIVAAASNTGKITYPAALPGAIGVKCCGELQLGQIVKSADAKDGIDIASRLPRSAALGKLESEYGFPKIEANSLIAPYVSARLLKAMSMTTNSGKAVDLLDLPLYEREAGAIAAEDIAVPIIGIAEPSIDYALGLHAAFQAEDYVSAMLTTRLETDFYRNVFHMQQCDEYKDMLEYLHMLCSDVVLLDTFGMTDAKVHALIDRTVVGNRPIGETLRVIEESFAN